MLNDKIKKCMLVNHVSGDNHGRITKRKTKKDDLSGKNKKKKSGKKGKSESTKKKTKEIPQKGLRRHRIDASESSSKNKAADSLLTSRGRSTSRSEDKGEPTSSHATWTDLSNSKTSGKIKTVDRD